MSSPADPGCASSSRRGRARRRRAQLAGVLDAHWSGEPGSFGTADPVLVVRLRGLDGVVVGVGDERGLHRLAAADVDPGPALVEVGDAVGAAASAGRDAVARLGLNFTRTSPGTYAPRGAARGKAGRTPARRRRRRASGSSWRPSASGTTTVIVAGGAQRRVLRPPRAPGRRGRYGVAPRESVVVTKFGASGAGQYGTSMVWCRSSTRVPAARRVRRRARGSRSRTIVGVVGRRAGRPPPPQAASAASAARASARLEVEVIGSAPVQRTGVRTRGAPPSHGRAAVSRR